jgi:glycosyltransferase involved in cell wall biosynthesis
VSEGAGPPAGWRGDPFDFESGWNPNADLPPFRLPRISIVTASFNAVRWIEDAIRSVLDQGYPDLEYVVVDGGSTDGTVDVIRRYADRLTWWVSEPDGGMWDAINKGFARTTGDVMAWLNADDKLVPGALHVVGDVFGRFPEVEWVTSNFPLSWDERGCAVTCVALRGFAKGAFLRGENLPGGRWYATSHIQQESTFWRRSLWARAGGRVDTTYDLAGDFELWARFYDHGNLVGVNAPLGGFRVHDTQKTAGRLDVYRAEALRILADHGGRPHGRAASWMRRVYEKCRWRRVRRVANWFGLVYPTRTLGYDHLQKGWYVGGVRL